MRPKDLSDRYIAVTRSGNIVAKRVSEGLVRQDAVKIAMERQVALLVYDLTGRECCWFDPAGRIHTVRLFELPKAFQAR